MRTLLLYSMFVVLASGPATAISVKAVTQSSNSNVERRFNQTVRPFLTQYCMGCHGTATPAAQFDMRPYSSMDKVLDDFPHWILMSEKVGRRPDAAENGATTSGSGAERVDRLDSRCAHRTGAQERG
jgi:hypothetical protein